MSEEVENSKNKRVKEIIDDLRSRNDRRIIGALKRVPHEGSADMIEALFDLYALHQSKDVVVLLEKTVHNLKDTDCIDPMIELLHRKEKRNIHQKVLAALWQSGLDVSDHLEILIDVAITGEFMTAVEVLTIIENQEFKDDVVLTNAIQVMDKVVEKKDEKQKLMVTMRQVLLDKLLG